VKTKRRTFYFDKTVEVEIDIDDLEEAGYHHEDDCPAKSVKLPTSTTDALASLHQQAHPSQSLDPLMCREEPCRSLSLEQVMGRPVAA
jgi:hypothetical protein